MGGGGGGGGGTAYPMRGHPDSLDPRTMGRPAA